MNDNNLSHHIAAQLSTLRKQQRYTQKEFAALAGLNPNYYAKVERGEAIPSLKTIYKLAKAFRVSATDIVGF